MILPPEEKEMTAKMHRMHLPKVGEGVIYVPGGVPYEVDTLQQYALGSFMRIGNKEFVYALAGGTLNTDLGAMNSLAQKVGFSAIQANYDAGVTRITLTVGANSGITKDQLAGGEVVIFPHGMTNSFTRGIVANSLVASGGGTLTLDLDSPTPVEITTDGNGECIASPYSNVQTSAGDWAMVMGMPTCVADSGEYLWLQVSGPSWAALAGAVGDAAKELEVVFVGNGSLSLESIAGDEACQHAGVIISPGTNGASQGAPFIMLQIAH